MENQRNTAIPPNWDRTGLPGWTYHSDAFLELEKDHLFRNHWQIACHENDVANPGDYLAFDLFEDRALILRDRAGTIRAFHNLCRHRGSRVVPDDAGNCRNALVCPFHGWVYNLDGTLRGPARPETFPDLGNRKIGLKPIEMEIWHGLVFIRFAPGPQPSVAKLMEPFEAELSPYRIDATIPDGRPWTQQSPINWKSVRDVDNEGYHVALAHPALQDLYGSSYYDEPFIDGVCRSWATCNPSGGRRWSVRHYTKFTEPGMALPENQERAWIYYTLFPNNVIAVTPELMQFYQEFPLSTNQTQLRGGVYRYRDETRRQKLSRYLAMRIDRETMEEDVKLTIWSNEAMKSSAFDGFLLSDLEYGVRTHHDLIRAAIPAAEIEVYPGEEALRATGPKDAPG